MDWELETKLLSSEQMITVYQDHIEELEDELKGKTEHIKFLEEQLEYKSMGRPEEHLSRKSC